MTKEKEPIITVLEPTVAENTQDAPFTHYVLVPVDEKGKEIGQEFSYPARTFNKSPYYNRTAKPEGNASSNAKFKVKKKK